jgi:hypothetical protein
LDIGQFIFGVMECLSWLVLVARTNLPPLVKKSAGEKVSEGTGAEVFGSSVLNVPE